MSAYVKTSILANARLFASKANGNDYQFTSIYNETKLAYRNLIFKATDKRMLVGLEIPKGVLEGKYIFADDFMVEKITNNVLDVIDSININGKNASDEYINKYNLNLNVDEIGEKILRINYENTTNKLLYASLILMMSLVGCPNL